LACLADEPVAPSVRQELDRLADRVAIIPVSRWSRPVRALGSLTFGRTATEGAFASRALAATLDAWGRQTRFHACFVTASSMVPYLRLPALRDTPAVIDLVDVDSQKWLDYSAVSRGPRAWLYRLEGRRLRALETPLPTWARGVLLSSTAEVSLYRSFAAAGPVHAINNGVDLDYFRPAPPVGGARCVFVGALDYRPNIDAACWFCREVWPLIVAKRPEARFTLVGRRPVPAIQQLGRLPGVDLVGQVPDVRPYVSEATVVVAPLRIARGVQNKVLEALAMAKATVVSPAALGGVRAVPGQHLLAATSPAEWVDAICRVFDDAELRAALGAAGRKYVETHHTWEKCLQPLVNILGLEARTLDSRDCSATPTALTATTTPD
jgi:sugar transferase (PEP-CTERM/EpsH1 system associated)